MSEEPGGQERRNAQMAIARMVLGNWRRKLDGARANDKKSAVFDTKQTFSDKKTPFRGLWMPVRWGRGWFRNDLSLPSSGVFQNDPPPSRSIHHRRRRRPHRLLGHDCSQDPVPGYKRLFDLPRPLTKSGPGAARNYYAAATAVLRSSEIARTTVPTSSGTQVGGVTKGLLGRAATRTSERADCALNETW